LTFSKFPAPPSRPRRLKGSVSRHRIYVNFSPAPAESTIFPSAPPFFWQRGCAGRSPGAAGAAGLMCSLRKNIGISQITADLSSGYFQFRPVKWNWKLTQSKFLLRNTKKYFGGGHHPMKKRFLALTLALAMTSALLTGCRGGKGRPGGGALFCVPQKVRPN